MLTKAFVALKHAEYLVTLLLLIAAVLTSTPQGDLHTGVTDIVGCHGCACPKPPDERSIMNHVILKEMLPCRQKPSTVISMLPRQGQECQLGGPGLMNLPEVC